MFKISFVFALMSLTFLLASCTNKFSPDVYTEDNICEVTETIVGTVINTRKIKIKQSANNKAGLKIGSTMGKTAVAAAIGGQTTIAGIAGFISGGGVIGHFIRNRTLDGLEYQVQLADKTIVTIAQAIPPAISIGTKVYIIKSAKGYSKIVPIQ